ncbi:hypothetical protein PIB30_107305, partial [Stylosanthes scabra]|nr:hypothetical protein [Stylosanthes scabra]
ARNTVLMVAKRSTRVQNHGGYQWQKSMAKMDGAILPAVVRGFPQRSEGSFHVGNASRPFNWGFVHEGKSRLFDLGAHGSQPLLSIGKEIWG